MILAFESAVLSRLNESKFEQGCYVTAFEAYDYNKFIAIKRNEYSENQDDPPSAGSKLDRLISLNNKAWRDSVTNNLKCMFRHLTPDYQSSHAIILISGWLSEDFDEIIDWKAVLD